MELKEKHIIDPSKIPGDMDLAKNNPLSVDDDVFILFLSSRL